MTGRVATILALSVIVTTASCDTAGSSARGSCRRLDSILDDLDDGDITSGDELRERYENDLTFAEGSSLDESKQRLLGYIDDGDEDGAALETNHLLDLCAGVQDR